MKANLGSGATRGIGAALAEALAAAGADIILVQRNTENVATRDTIVSLGRKADIYVADLANNEEVKQIVPNLVKQGRRIDILVNCGGIQRRHPAEEFPDEDWNEVIQVNLTSCFTLARETGKHMLEVRKTNDPGFRGKIINIASLQSFQGGLTIPAYASAKHGILGMTKALSNDWAGKGINVNAIAPGYINTEMNAALIANPTRSRQIMERIPAQRWGKPEDFKSAVIFLASSGSDYVCGDAITVDGGWMAR